MNMLQILFGRRVGVRCAQPAENAPGPKGRNASIHGLTPLEGCILAKGGRTDEALAALRRAFEHDVSLRANARTDADLAALRDNPDFIELTESPGAGMRRGGPLQAQIMSNARTL